MGFCEDGKNPSFIPKNKLIYTYSQRNKLSFITAINVSLMPHPHRDFAVLLCNFTGWPWVPWTCWTYGEFIWNRTLMSTNVLSPEKSFYKLTYTNVFILIVMKWENIMDVYITVFLFISGPNRTNWTKRRIWLPWPPSEYLLFVVYLSGNEHL